MASSLLRLWNVTPPARTTAPLMTRALTLLAQDQPIYDHAKETLERTQYPELETTTDSMRSGLDEPPDVHGTSGAVVEEDEAIIDALLDEIDSSIGDSELDRRFIEEEFSSDDEEIDSSIDDHLPELEREFFEEVYSSDDDEVNMSVFY